VSTKGAARVRVPCSTSNLGAGFDCLGLALDRYLEVSFQPDDAGVRVVRSGTLESLDVDPEDDTVVSAFRSAVAARGGDVISGTFRMTSGIPVGRGLGSSAAATVAGLLLADAATRERMAESQLDQDAGSATQRYLEAAVAIEGHPDNAAPALMGGLVATVAAAGGPLAFRLPLSPHLGFAFAAPATEVSTAAARRALPATVPHQVAVRALGRVAALARGLSTGDPKLLRAGFEDELHVPYRLPLVPGASDAFAAARDAGAHAVTISGSGSGLIAVATRSAAPAVAVAMAASFGRTGDGVVELVLEPDLEGARILEAV
jgi:homoserine kinase